MKEQEDLPLVSICSITYNHAPYIRQCLDGFLMQKTNFKYEIIIHDDCSTDGTTEIIKEYAEKYPNLIRPIYQKENQYSKGVRGIFANFVFPKAKGKYIAMCEGDDYWTDPLKLQKQVDFLEANPSFSMCFHYYDIYYQDKNSFTGIGPNLEVKEYAFDLEYYVMLKWVTRTLTVLFKKDYLDIHYYLSFKYRIDAVLFYCLLKKGDAFLMADNMGVYRVHCGGVWSSSSRLKGFVNNLRIFKNIYDVDKCLNSAALIKNWLCINGYLGISFFSNNVYLYMNCLYAIFKEYGLKETLYVMYRTLNYFKR